MGAYYVHPRVRKQSTEEETNKERELTDASRRAKCLEGAFAFHTRHVE